MIQIRTQEVRAPNRPPISPNLEAMASVGKKKRTRWDLQQAHEPSRHEQQSTTTTDDRMKDKDDIDGSTPPLASVSSSSITGVVNGNGNEIDENSEDDLNKCMSSLNSATIGFFIPATAEHIHCIFLQWFLYYDCPSKATTATSNQ